DNTLYDAFGQRQASTIYHPLNQYHVVMEVAPRYWQSPEMLKEIFVSTSGGGVRGTQNTNAVAGTVSRAAVETSREQSIKRAASIDGRFQGTARAFQQSLANELFLVVAALAVMYVVLGMLYESYLHPVTILSTLPSAGVGAVLALMAFGKELSVMAVIGVLLLIGIVKKNAIMMIDVALEVERRDGVSPREAIFAACLLRFRPIMMTTMA